MGSPSQKPKNGKSRASVPRPIAPQPLSASSSDTDKCSPTADVRAGLTCYKRNLVNVACGTCQKKKRKCDGTRPACGFCKEQHFPCEYETGPGESRKVARKRKLDATNQELIGFQEIFQMLITKPRDEAWAMIQTIRAVRDITDIPTLIQRQTIGLDIALERPLLFEQSALDKLELSLLTDSAFIVPAKPWTMVGGDGITSHLVSIFLTLDQPFLTTFVDQDMFLKSMRSCNLDSTEFCSPFLVNAICAFASFYSSSVQEVGQLQAVNLQNLYHREAKRHFQLENGKVTLASIVGAYLTFLYCSTAGLDRAGTIFRYAACEMLQRISARKIIASAISPSGKITNDADRIKRQLAKNRTIWGIFFYECLSGFMYMQLPLTQLPECPKIFSDPTIDTASGSSVAMDRYLIGLASLSELFYDALKYTYCTQNVLGTSTDIEARIEIYQNLVAWRATLTNSTEKASESAAQMMMLRCFFSNAVISLMRPLDGLDISMPHGLGTPRSLCVHHCNEMMTNIRAFCHIFENRLKSGLRPVLYIAWVVCLTLVNHLDTEPRCRKSFTEACYLIFIMKENIPVANALLKGLQAMAEQAGVVIPQECLLYFDGAELSTYSAGDIPIAYAIPQQPKSTTVPPANEFDPVCVGMELGQLISRWNEFTLQS